MKKIYILFFIYILASPAFSQTGSVEGIVLDSLDKPVAFAGVAIQNTAFATNTDESGKFSFNDLAIGKYTVAVSMIGYSTRTKQVDIIDGKKTEMLISLQSNMQNLAEVVISDIQSISGIGHMGEVHDGIIYSGKKNEVLILDSLDANTAQNNPRQVLGRIPGANYSETEGSGFPSNGIGFRGLNPTQSMETNTRQNGYNITGDLYGYPESYYLPPLEAIERIETTRGASSLQFGPQFGGVINYIMKSAPKNKRFEYTTQQTAGSYGLFNSFHSVGGTLRRWSYYTYVQGKSVDGWRPNSQVKQALGFARIEFKPTDKLTFGLEYSLLRNNIKMPGGLSDEQYNQNAAQSFRSRNWLNSPWNIIAFTAQYKVNANTLLTFKSATNISARNLVWRNEDGGPQTPDSIDVATNTYVPREVEHESFMSNTSELRLLTSYKIAKVEQTFAAGVRYFAGKMKRQGGGPGSTGSDFDLHLYGGGYEYDLEFTTNNIAPFIENTFHFGKRLSITPGIRYEYIHSTVSGNKLDEDAELPMHVSASRDRYIPLAGLGVQVKTTCSTNIYANISQAYRPTDYSNQTPIGVSSKVDPNLKDASGYNADAGWRGTVKNYLNFDLGVFYMAYNNRIGIETLEDANGNIYTYRTNVANSVHQGVESYIEFNPVKMLTSSTRFGTVSIFNSFAYIDALYVSGMYKGNSVEFAPKKITRCGVTYAIKHFSTTFLVSNTAASYTDANNTKYSEDATVGLIPAYQVMDWSASIKIKNYNAKFGVNNLADAKYFTKRTDEYPGPGIIPSLGRSFYVGIGAKF